MRDYDDDDDDYVTVVEKKVSVSAFLWGALIGAGAMLLYAPRSGAETRRELNDSYRRLRDTADAAIRDMQETVTESVREVRDNVESHLDATRTAVDSSRDAARGARTDLGQRWEQGREGVRSAYRPRPGTAAREADEE